MSSEAVIELSVEETNQLRAQLGLAPLRISNNNQKPPLQLLPSGPSPPRPPDQQAESAVLELSVDETNALRAQLGLAPLRRGVKKTPGEEEVTSTAAIVHHAPAENQGQQREAAERIERARLQRQVQEGIQKRFLASRVAAAEEEKETARSWAQRVRQPSSSSSRTQKEPSDQSETPKTTSARDMSTSVSYGEQDLHGMRVGHSQALFEQGSSMILTLADAPLVKSNRFQEEEDLPDEEGETDVLENILLVDQQKQQDGLKAKRQLELGRGRAAGYAGYDDDEFEELGGTRAPSRWAASGLPKDRSSRPRGFQLGRDDPDDNDQQKKDRSDLFASLAGQAISLESASELMPASDFMTAEEAEREEAQQDSKKKKKKKAEFKKKKTKKKDSQRHLRLTGGVEDEDDQPTEDAKIVTSAGSSLLEELERTAGPGAPSRKRRRRRDDDDDDDDNDDHEDKKHGENDIHHKDSENAAVDPAKNYSAPDQEAERTAASMIYRYNEIMAKGNARTALAFAKTKRPASTADEADDEVDDALLQGAVAKARRLNRLREMSQSKGADAVMETVRQLQGTEPPPVVSGSTVSFSIDETREFTRALRARTEQAEREQARKATTPRGVAVVDEVKSSSDNGPKIKTESLGEGDQGDESLPGQNGAAVVDMDAERDTHEDMDELAKDIKVEADEPALEGATGTAVSLGRGLGGVLGLLQKSGELTRKNAGKEEMRGRAKDRRFYDDYEPLDLSSVVRIDPRTATEKDKELAQRQIKLEYRDKNGQLLTRKEAFRDLSYQFHGYGSGKRKQEKRMQQLERERAATRLASKQATGDAGTLGALQATQKATGKAFVAHKT